MFSIPNIHFSSTTLYFFLTGEDLFYFPILSISGFKVGSQITYQGWTLQAGPTNTELHSRIYYVYIDRLENIGYRVPV